MSPFRNATTISRSDAAVHWALLAFLAWVPFPLGSNRPWSWSLLAIMVSLLLLGWTAAILRGHRPSPVSPRRIALPAVLFALVCAYALIQIVPGLPGAVASHYWSLMDAVDPNVRLDTISVSPHDTLTAVMRLLSYGAVFFLFLQTTRPAEMADRAVAAIAIVTGAYSAYGLVAFLGGGETILWYPKWAYFGSLTAVFVNRNSFATFAGLGLLCAFAHVTRVFLTLRIDRSDLRYVAGDVLARLTPGVLGAMAAIPLNTAALFLTESRAGIVVTVLAVILFSVGLSLKLRRRRGVAVFLVVFVVSTIGYYFSLSGAGFVERLTVLAGSDWSQNARLLVDVAVASKIAEAPWLGTGYGTFEDVFKTIRTPEMPGRFTKAHNTYLENALELGAPAATALFLSVALLAGRCLTALKRRRGMFIYGWMATCVTVLVGLHALVDFSLQIPAVAVYFAAILGIGCSQSWSSTADTSAGPTIPPRGG